MESNSNREKLIKILDLVNDQEKGLEVAQIVADLSHIFSKTSISRPAIRTVKNDEEMEIS